MTSLSEIAAALGIDAPTARILLRRTRIRYRRYYSPQAARRIKRQLSPMIASERGPRLTADEAAAMAELIRRQREGATKRAAERADPILSPNEDRMVLPWTKYHELRQRERTRQALRPNALAPLDRLMSGR